MTLMNSNRLSVKNVDLLTEEDVRKSAEAVVDAAILKKRLSQMIEVSEETRNALVQLIVEDPSQTALLFRDSSWERH